MQNAAKVATIEFPSPHGIDINMMPIVMGESGSIPSEYRQYAPLVEACGTEQVGKVGYLTITESRVSTTMSQRRGGMHTESPGTLDVMAQCLYVPWGGGWGHSDGYRQGGLYMASTVDNSCTLWDVCINNPGTMGDCEHLREIIGAGTLLQAGELWWLTDRCPHESLPIPAGTYRQFFRLVTSQVAIWFSRHSTPNRLGVMPDCSVTDIDKFSLI